MTLAKKQRFTYLLIALSLFLCIFFFRIANGYDAEYRIKKVIDGDTILLSNGRSVRYIGMDSPETREYVGSRWIYKPEKFSEEAKEYNKQALAGGTVGLEFDKDKKDKFGRLLAYVYADGIMINEELVRQGYATIYVYPPNVKYLDRLVKAQEEARAEKRGIWSECKEITFDEISDNVGTICTIKGKVIGFEHTGSMAFLNFKDKKGRDYSAMIHNRNYSFFAQINGVPISRLVGEEVKITTKILSKKRPYLILFHPSQIEVIQ